MTPATNEQILKRLNEAETKDRVLPEPLQFFRELTHARIETAKRLRPPKITISAHEVRRRLDSGLPILPFADLDINWEQASILYQQVADLLVKYAGVFEHISPSGKKLTIAELVEAARTWFEGREPPPDSKASPVILHTAIQPFLAVHREMLAGHVAQEQWLHGYCPICGGNPDFAYLEPVRGERWLVCSRCDMEWVFKRLECPCCGSQDEKALSFYTDDSGRYRLYVCENCHRCLKAIDLRKAPPDILFPIERILTANLDAQARDDGYLPCAGYRRELWPAASAVTAPYGNR